MKDDTKALWKFLIGGFLIIVPIGTLTAWATFEISYFIGSTLLPNGMPTLQISLGIFTLVIAGFVVIFLASIWRRL